jgi:hypothetical protein
MNYHLINDLTDEEILDYISVDFPMLKLLMIMDITKELIK